jgi:N-acetylmuramic acid 6-phosphate etherase
MTPEPITEQRAAGGADLDLRSTADLVTLINDEDATVAGAVRATIPTLTAAIDAIVERLARGGRLVYAGAGSSGRLAAVDAAELPPSYGLDPRRVVALVAGGAPSVASADESAEDDPAAGAGAIRAAGVGQDDVVVVLSASGRTPYALGAASAARASGALTVGVACVPDAELAPLVDHHVAAVVGPEVIAGSTRMKAGTAQKLVLNTISTVAMLRLGKTYGDLMVDVVATNAKLRARTRSAVALATEAPSEAVDRALDAAGGDPKVAIVSLLGGLDAGEARARLAAAGGVVRKALEG